MYKIEDESTSETAESFEEAVNIISEWFTADGFKEETIRAAEEAAEFIEEPDEGDGVGGLQDYADDLIDYMARELGHRDGGNSHIVTAATEAGLSLTVTQFDVEVKCGCGIAYELGPSDYSEAAPDVGIQHGFWSRTCVCGNCVQVVDAE